MKKLRRRGIGDDVTANAYLQAEYWPAHNARFAQPPAAAADFNRRPPTARALDQVFRLEEPRTVGRDWVVRYHNRALQLAPQSRYAPAPSTVTVCEWPDGRLAIEYRGRVVPWTDVTTGAPARPVLIGSYAELVPLAPTLADLQGLGVTVLPCAAAAGLLLVVDASGLLVSDGGAEIVSARHALMTLDDGSGGTPGPTVSLWQGNLACLRAERWFSIAMRSDAVAWAAVGTP